ncbi:MAG: phosphate ABC transporter substrate-binding protein PstS [Bdellovibrionales bacterium]|nr:phosphate ABC transporter substrate-binding protein PstS [Bdellovibrionales bacterium]
MKNVMFKLPTLALAAVLWVAAANAADLINGAGATFPYPLYSKWFSDYQKIDRSIQINYQSIGSGGGIRQLIDRTVDFGASDAPMTDEQIQKAKDPVVHVPMVLGAVVVTYNVPGVKAQLKMTPDIVADLFLGKIQKWDDARITKLNPGVAIPKDHPVMVVHRSDGSGTTAIFSDYLSKVSAEWKEKVGTGTALKWPTGLGAKGNEGVTGTVKSTPGTVGYVEYLFAETNQLSMAELKNASGNFVKPNVKSVSQSAKGSLKQIPEDFRVSITNAQGKESYPISGFTYILVYKTLSADKGKKLVSFLKWAVQDGQKTAETLFYAPLPTELVKKIEKKIADIQFK